MYRLSLNCFNSDKNMQIIFVYKFAIYLHIVRENIVTKGYTNLASPAWLTFYNKWSIVTAAMVDFLQSIKQKATVLCRWPCWKSGCQQLSSHLRKPTDIISPLVNSATLFPQFAEKGTCRFNSTTCRLHRQVVTWGLWASVHIHFEAYRLSRSRQYI